MVDLCTQLLNEIAAGDVEQADRTLQQVNALAADPSICNQQTLDALKKARTLAMIQRSHIQRRLRTVRASHLFYAPQDAGLNTWQIDG